MMTITLEIYGLRVLWPDIGIPYSDSKEWERATARLKKAIIQMLSDDRMELTCISRGQDCGLNEVSGLTFAPGHEEELEENDDDEAVGGDDD